MVVQRQNERHVKTGHGTQAEVQENSHKNDRTQQARGSQDIYIYITTPNIGANTALKQHLGAAIFVYLPLGITVQVSMPWPVWRVRPSPQVT